MIDRGCRIYNRDNIALALLAGGITILPLVLFLKGNRALNMTMASLLFYSNPTMQLLLGVVVFSEEFMPRDLLAFGLIWIGIAVYFTTRARVARLVVPTP